MYFIFFQEHVKSHSEEYKFQCKFCNASFINRNVMVSHQKDCEFSTDSPKETQEDISAQITKRPGLQITPVITPVSNHSPQNQLNLSPNDPPAAKRMKIVLNGESLKEFVMARKDEQMTLDPPQMTVLPFQRAAVFQNNNNNNSGHQPNTAATADSPDNNYASGVIKHVVRKRAPIFPFEPEDHYVPDNNSNNIISKNDISPSPTTIEKKQGYCLRPFNETGQQRYICTVCGKHYTTMYNMRQHRNIHTGSGLHSCRYCGRSFTHKHVWEVR